MGLNDICPASFMPVRWVIGRVSHRSSEHDVPSKIDQLLIVKNKKKYKLLVIINEDDVGDYWILIRSQKRKA